MAQTYVNLRDDIESILQDSTNATFTVAELDLIIKDALRKLSRFAPYEVKESFTIESRTGSATATTADRLVDTGESQFVSGDVGKIVFNVKDNTWAVITTFNSSSNLTLSKDIFTSGEEYKIFNKDCFSDKEINISDITDRLADPVVAEYPLGTKRNVKVVGDILTLDIEDDPDDSKVVTSGDAPDTEVLVYFDKKHRVSQLTDRAGAVDLVAGYAAGDTSMVIDGITTDEVIEAEQEFTIADVRGVYRVTTEVTIAAGEATVTFWPGLQSVVVNDQVVTFKLSTLPVLLEPLFCNYAAALAAISKARSYIGTVNVGSQNTGRELEAWGRNLLAETERDLRRLRPTRISYEYWKEM